MALQHKAFPTVDFKVLDEDQGLFEAYVSVFGLTDHANERVMPGFFKKSLENRLPKIVFAHNWDRPIGKALPGTEERYAGDKRLPPRLKDHGGLYCLGQLNLGVQDGRDTLSHLKFGSLDEFSFGYDVTRATNAKDGVRELHEGNTYEVSPVLVGCNPATQLVSVKSLDETAPTFATLPELRAYVDRTLGETLYPLLFEDTDSIEEWSTKAHSSLVGLPETISESLRAIFSSAADSEEIVSEFKHVFSAPALAAGRFADQLDAALAAVKGATDRYERYLAVKEADGRAPSPDRREQLLAIHEAVGALLAKTAPPEPLDLSLLQMKASARRRRLLALGDGAPLL